MHHAALSASFAGVSLLSLVFLRMMVRYRPSDSLGTEFSLPPPCDPYCPPFRRRLRFLILSAFSLSTVSAGCVFWAPSLFLQSVPLFLPRAPHLLGGGGFFWGGFFFFWVFFFLVFGFAAHPPLVAKGCSPPNYPPPLGSRRECTFLFLPLLP